MARSISATSRTLTGFNSTPTDGATDWMAANWAGPEARPGSRRTPARRTLGAISFSSSSHFALKPYSNEVNPGSIAARPRKAVNKPGANRIGNNHEHDGHRASRLQQRRRSRVAGDNDDIRRERDQFGRIGAKAIGIAGGPAGLDVHVTTDGPARL